eukprot:gnl/Spiro4/12317_TR6497_c0_g1_i1.p1 gnl/Spiro4/12317_TR6497_c0_g1~~gnl/Spiro4/12317_TR6497_c0_g1_i1.p1  ORF type:complete len:439 (-),score=79.30 gnl/Spiro4/12317_TR6497_c0_g1_i1:55-1317(-)
MAEKYVGAFINNKYSLNAKIQKMRASGKSEAECLELSMLASETQSVINSKLLKPVLRTRCHRAIFQQNTSNSVSVKLDTNISMMIERPRQDAWHRTEEQHVNPNEIYHFPHASLVVALPVGYTDMPPWLNELLRAGLIHPVSSFSSFLHGVAALMPENLVQTKPPWFADSYVTPADVGLRRNSSAQMPNRSPPEAGRPGSLRAKGTPTTPTTSSTKPAAAAAAASTAKTAPVIPAQSIHQFATVPVPKPVVQPKPPGYVGLPPNSRGGISSPNSVQPTDEGVCATCHKCLCFPFACCCADEGAKKAPTRVEPKVYFANERTYLHWTTLAVTLASLAITLVSFGKNDERVMYAGYAMVAFAMIFSVYALWVFSWRANKLDQRAPGPYIDRLGPSSFAILLVLVLSANVLARFFWPQTSVHK